MGKIIEKKFNNASVSVWFYIDNIRQYDTYKNIVEKDDEFVCYFKFTKPSFICLGELLKQSDGNVAIFKTAQNALLAGENFVVKKYSLE